MDAPREDLIRMSTELRHDEEGNTLVGYAAVFNQDTEINSWEGRFTERIAPGAFKKTLVERDGKIKVLFNHGMDPSIGDKPLGRPREMKEDKRGLYVEVPLDDTSYNRDIKALLRSGALDGMSFRMSVTRDDWEDLDTDNPKRTIREIKLFEFGPVTFPAYEATEAGVRAHAPKAFKAWQESRGEPVAPEPEEDVERSVEPDDLQAPAPVDDHSEDPELSAFEADAVPDAPLDSEHPSHPRRQRLTAYRMDTALESVMREAEIALQRAELNERLVTQYEADNERCGG